MIKENKWEKFEQEYMGEINILRGLEFVPVAKKEFLFPGYAFIYKKAYALAFGMPALAFVFAFFFYTGPTVNDGNIAMLEDSNSRILNEINSLDNNKNIYEN